jgi:hypothetical protein
MCAIGAFAGGSAQALVISPDGSGANLTNIGGIDWNASTALVTQVAGFNKVPDTVVGDVVQVYAQGALSVFNDPAGNGLGDLGLGANGDEWTFVAGFREQVLTFSPGAPPLGILGRNASFIAVPGGDNYFRIYHGVKNSNNLQGTNFADGNLVLAGSLLPFDPLTGGGFASFSLSSLNLAQPLDQFGGNNYPSISSTAGNGGGRVDILVTTQNNAYIKDDLIGATLQLPLNYTTQQTLPFGQTNPSSCVWNGSALIIAAGTGGGGPCGGGATGTIGAYNGLPSGVYPAPIGNYTAANNQVLQLDGTMNFPVVPSPTPLALAATGLIGLWASRARKRAKSAG